MRFIWVIEEAWSDSTENQTRAAFGYRAIGYVLTKEDAEAIKARRGKLPIDFCWAAPKDADWINFYEIPRLI